MYPLDSQTIYILPHYIYIFVHMYIHVHNTYIITCIILKPPHYPQSVEKLSSVKLVPGVKKIGDHWYMVTLLYKVLFIY